MLIDHVCLNVTNLSNSLEFYRAALAPLGVTVLHDHSPHAAGLGKDGKASFWLIRREPLGAAHLAFAAPDRATVSAFHAAGLAAGATCNGAPGLRPQYHSNYFGAFLLDPDGYNIEAVCHKAES
jgi:catechol 2,3-dioxygenase-like lactoylglutathione lyase family enzyme